MDFDSAGCPLPPDPARSPSLAGGFAANGYAAHSPGGYSLGAALTFMFLTIILGSTERRAPQGFAPIAIGLGLTLIHLIGILVTNLSVNPARSMGPAVLVDGWTGGRVDGWTGGRWNSYGYSGWRRSQEPSIPSSPKLANQQVPMRLLPDNF